MTDLDGNKTFDENHLSPGTRSSDEELIEHLSPQIHARLQRLGLNYHRRQHHRRHSREGNIPERLSRFTAKRPAPPDKSIEPSTQETTRVPSRPRQASKHTESVSDRERTSSERNTGGRNTGNGWRTKTRCSADKDTNPSVEVAIVYLYDSTKCGDVQDPDADLEIFRCHFPNHPDLPEISPARDLHHTPVDPRRQLSEVLAFADDPKAGNKRIAEGPRTLRHEKGTSTVWPLDPDMLEARVPNCRIMMIGFDISTAPSGSLAASTAAIQLNEELLRLRSYNQPPLAILGHAFGGLIALRALFCEPTLPTPSARLHSETVGLFLFSFPTLTSPQCKRALAKLYSFRQSEKMYSIMCTQESLASLRTQIRKTASPTESIPQGLEKRLLHVSNRPPYSTPDGCSIYLMLAQDDVEQTSSHSISEYLGQPFKTVALKNDLSHTMRFTGPRDQDFVRTIIYIIVESHTRNSQNMILSAAAGRHDEVERLVNLGADINACDQS